MTIQSGIRLAAIARARSLVMHHNAGTPATERLEALKRSLGVSSIEAESMHSSGSVRRRPDGRFEVRYSNTLRPTRRNFTVAHELGHIVLDQFLPHMAQVRPNERTMAGGRYCAIERLVDRLASELLMPENAIAEALRAECVQQRSEGAIRIRYLQAIAALRAKFEVSETALVLRLQELPQLKTIHVRISRNRRITRCDSPRIVVRHSSGVRVIPSANRPKPVSKFLETCVDGAYHDILLRSACRTRVLPCQGWTRKLQTDWGKLEEYCIVGWTWNRQPIPDYDDAR